MLNNTIDFVCAGRENPILKSHIDSHPLETEQAAAFAKWIEIDWGQGGGVGIMSLSELVLKDRELQKQMIK